MFLKLALIPKGIGSLPTGTVSRFCSAFVRLHSVSLRKQQQLLQLGLQFSGFRGKRLCIKYCNVLAILSYFWLILPIVRHCTAYGCSNRSNKVGWENLSWHKHRFCYMARAGTTEHLNMLFFGKICVWRYVSPYYLLEFTTFAVDHDPNASLPCAFTWKPIET